MMVEQLSWSHRLQTRLRREAEFLPKRLGLLALLLFVLYLVLLIRTEYRAVHAHVGFVEASLKSKLVADYDVIERPVAPFAPLRLALIRAKIQDENPYLSEREVAALVQMAVAAAAAPIVRATPTPRSGVPAVVNAAAVVGANLLLDAQVLPGGSTPLLYQHTPAPVTPATNGFIGTGAHPAFPITNNLLDRLDGAERRPIPTATVDPVLLLSALSPAPMMSPQSAALVVALTSDTSLETSEGPTLTQITVSPLPVPDTPAGSTLPTTSLLPVTNVPPDASAPVTHLAASQPNLRDTPSATPSTLTPVAAVVVATSAPSATWTPWPTTTPGPTWTVAPTTAMRLPAATEDPPAGAQLSATATPLTLPPATVTATITAMPTTSPTGATTPPAVATLSPTLTLAPTITATVMAVTPPTPTPTSTALPLVDCLTAYVQGDKVYLEWPPATDLGIVGYNLYRQDATNGGDERINVAPLLSAAYIDTVDLDGNQYAYRVTTVDQLAQESPPSQTVTVTVADHKPPQPPNQVVAQVDGEHVQFHWDANTEPDFAGYHIYRDTHLPVARTQGSRNGATLITTFVYTDTLPLDGQTYYYVLTAVDVAGNESAPSREVQVPTINVAVPAPPSGLTASFEDDDDEDDDEDNEDEINLKWQANQETDVVGYRLYRSTTLPVDPTAAPLHKKPLLITLHYRDEDLARSTTYYYVVVAVDQDQNVSLPSAPVAVTVPQ